MRKLTQKASFVYLWMSVLMGCAASQVPMPVLNGTSDSENYLKLADRYYYLDKQQFKEIICELDVPSITKSVDMVKKQLKPLKKNVVIKDNSSNFTLTYSTKSGIHFSEPKFYVILKTKQGLPNPEMAEKGVNMINMGFKDQVFGIKETIRSIFETYQSPKKRHLKDLTIAQNKKDVIVKYNLNNNYFIEKHSGHTIQVSQNVPNISIEATQKYIKIVNEKLILEKANVLIKRPDSIIKTDISLKYQYLGKIIFPKKIGAASEITFQKTVQKGEFDIYFINCQVK